MENKIIDLLNKKNLSKNSIVMYIRQLRILNDNKEITNLDFLKDKKKVMEDIKNKKPNTQRNYLISICSVLKSLVDDENNVQLKKLYDYYFDELMKLSKELKEEQEKNEKSETQKENWIEFKDVQNVLKDMMEEVKDYNKKTITKQQYDKLLKTMILSLYVLVPPRRNKDYQKMEILKTKKIPKEQKNYLSLPLNQFIFRDYKTAKTEMKKNKDGVVVDIPEELRNIINLYLSVRQKPSPYFLVSYDGEPLESVNAITSILNKIFGKKISSSILRHSFLTHHYGKDLDKLKEMKNISEKMSHSTAMQQEYIKKD